MNNYLSDAHKLAKAIPLLPNKEVKRVALKSLFELLKKGLRNGSEIDQWRPK